MLLPALLSRIISSVVDFFSGNSSLIVCLAGFFCAAAVRSCCCRTLKRAKPVVAPRICAFSSTSVLYSDRFSRMSNFDPNAILRGAQLTLVGGKSSSGRRRPSVRKKKIRKKKSEQKSLPRFPHSMRFLSGLRRMLQSKTLWTKHKPLVHPRIS